MPVQGSRETETDTQREAPVQREGEGGRMKVVEGREGERLH